MHFYLAVFCLNHADDLLEWLYDNIFDGYIADRE